MLPYDHAFLEAELGRSKVFVTNYGLDCEASLAVEEERLICVKAVTGGAVQHSLELQDKQRGIYSELADADDYYIDLLDAKQATEAEKVEKQGKLVLEQAKQDKLNTKAAEIKAELAKVATNTKGYHQSLHEKNSLLGQEFVASGATISQLQSAIDGISSEKLPNLEARIATQLEHIMQLYASVLSITEKIGSLPAPADDPKNQILYRDSGGAIYYQRKIEADNTALTGHELSRTKNSPAPRTRALGSAAIQSVVEDHHGILQRIRVSFKQPSNA
jgi:hypothetical protein